MFDTPYYIVLFCIVIIQFDVWFCTALRYYTTRYVVCLSLYCIVLRIKLSKDKIYNITPGPESGFVVGVSFGTGAKIRFRDGVEVWF